MNAIVPQDVGAILERVIVQGDLSKLTPIERVEYYKQVCMSAGLNPLMKPLEFITLNGKLVLYALRAATDQLRALHNVSITILKREKIDDTYTVTARATMPNGRTDEAMGAVSLKGLAGDALANGYLKCETKAKRRVTLSICGLGMLDETEVDSIPGARITPSAGVEEQLTRDEIARADEVVAKMREWLVPPPPPHGSIGDAVYELENAGLNAEQTIYLWTKFEATPRRLMKKEQERLRNAAAQENECRPSSENVDRGGLAIGVTESAGDLPRRRSMVQPVPSDGTDSPAAPDTITDAARKRLEARISELKLDREQVKQYIGVAFGRAHFSELTKEEYRIVDSFVEIIGATTLDELAGFWKGLPKDDKITLTAAKNARKATLEAAQEPQV